ncbi:putative phage tail protein [unidentified eubacterium SCB49]|nr:putative phage tail protein [unidentified eubacterium SCB49]
MKKQHHLKITIINLNLLATFFFITNVTLSQVGINTTAPAKGAILDVESTDKGVFIPRVNIADLSTIAPITGIAGAAEEAAAAGLLVYNTNTTTGEGYHYWDGTDFTPLTTAPVNDDWKLTGNAGTVPGTNYLGTSDTKDLVIKTDDTERMRVLNTGEIGVGTTTPSSDFHMLNTGNIGVAAMALFENDGTEGVALSSYNSNTSNIYNSFEGATDGTYSGVFGVALTTGTGGIGITGSTNDWQNIGVVGSRFDSGGFDLGYGGLFINDLGYTGGFWSTSDKRLKKDINNISNALATIKSIKPVSYHFDIQKYPDMGMNTNLEYGFIAQELKNVLPNVVKEKMIPIKGARKSEINNNEPLKKELFLTVDYTRIIPILTQGIKEQQEIIETQNKKIEHLEVLVSKIQEDLNSLKN